MSSKEDESKKVVRENREEIRDVERWSVNPYDSYIIQNIHKQREVDAELVEQIRLKKAQQEEWKRSRGVRFKPILNDRNNPIFNQALKFRTANGWDNIVLMCGQKGSGKSWGAIATAEKIDPDFDVATQCFFDAKPFLEWFARPETVKKVAVIDEASVAYSSSQWFSIESRLVRNLMTTGRFKLCTLIFTFPVLSHFSRAGRELSTYYLFSTSRAVFKAHRWRINDYTGDLFPEYMETISIPAPSEKAIRVYEQMKHDWNHERYNRDTEFLRMVADADRIGKPFPLSYYLRAYKVGLMTYDESLKCLLNLEYNKNHAEIMLKSAVLRAPKDEASDDNTFMGIPVD